MFKPLRIAANMAEPDQARPTSPTTVRGRLTRLTPLTVSLTRFVPSCCCRGVACTMRSTNSWRVLSLRITNPNMEARKMVSGTTENRT